MDKPHGFLIELKTKSNSAHAGHQLKNLHEAEAIWEMPLKPLTGTIDEIMTVLKPK